MKRLYSAKQPAISSAKNRNELPSLMEPMLISSESRSRAELMDLAIDLAQKASALHNALPDGVRLAVSVLVRSMNCYYSNLIEGHYTHPIDIEKALNNEYNLSLIHI